MEGGPFQEYFYLELPVGVNETSSRAVFRRFIYVQDDKDRGRFPIRFGLEVQRRLISYCYLFLIILLLSVVSSRDTWQARTK